MGTLKELFGTLTQVTEKLSKVYDENELNKEIKRAKAVANTSKQAINLGKLMFEVDKEKGNTELIDEIMG